MVFYEYLFSRVSLFSVAMYLVPLYEFCHSMEAVRTGVVMPALYLYPQIEGSAFQNMGCFIKTETKTKHSAS